jgi:proton-coupled amino acid transporter
MHEERELGGAPLRRRPSVTSLPPEIVEGEEEEEEWIGGEPEEEEGEAEVDAHAVGLGGDLTSAVLGIVKGMVGPAILYLPHGFAASGWLVSVPLMVLSTAMFLHSASALLDSWRLVLRRERARCEADNGEGSALLKSSFQQQQQQPQQPIVLSYPELAYRALGWRGEACVKLGIALMQTGVCLTYLIFVPQNLHSSAVQLLGHTRFPSSPTLWLLVMVGIQIPLSFIRDIRKLTPTNLAANCLILYGLLTCLGFAMKESATTQAGPTVAAEPTWGPARNAWSHFTHLTPFAPDWFLFIGTAVLLFEGSITLLVPLQEAVATEEQRERFPAVYRRTILSIVTFYFFFGITCWMAFGDTVRTVMTTSLPVGTLSTTVQLAYSIAVIFTFPLQNFPALEIVTRTLLPHHHHRRPPKGCWMQRNWISSCLVMLLAVVAACTMESLDKVVSLMGSLLGCPIAFVFPAIIHNQLDASLSTSRRWTNRVVASLGVVAMVLASITTLMTWS